MYYIFIQDNTVNGAGQCPCLDESVKNFEVSEELFNDFIKDSDKYIWNGEDVVENPEYDKVKEQKRKEHIQSLTCTKRDFALILQKYGISYSQLKELIATNDNAQLEWDLCTGLLRSNPLLDLMAGQLNITSEQLDNLFLYANGELEELVTTEENSAVAEENSDTEE
jgi:hypothetical protein